MAEIPPSEPPAPEPPTQRYLALNAVMMLVSVASLVFNFFIMREISQTYTKLTDDLWKMSKAYDNATATVVQRLADPKAELKVKFIVDSHLPPEHKRESDERGFKIFRSE